MMVTFSHKKGQLINALLWGALLALYLFFPLVTSREPVLFNSPDETANYVFARQFANGHSLLLPEPLNSFFENIIHPRSVTVSGPNLVPATFIGLPVLFGSLALFIGTWSIPFLTALFSVAAIAALYDCWKKYFGLSVARVAIVLAALHPALWYFTSRGLYHNVLFFSLLILCWWCYERMFQDRDTTHSVEWLLGSLFFLGAALMVRSSEALWVIPLVALILWYRKKEWRPIHWITLGLTIAGVFVVWLGAHTMGISAEGGYYIASGGWWQTTKAVLFPFGFHPVTIFNNVVTYGVWFFWPLTLLAILGVFQDDGARRGYRNAVFFISLFLVVYYGSAYIVDSVGVDRPTIGNSFVRYWLPFFILWSPFIAQGALVLMNFLEKFIKRNVFVYFVLVLFTWSFATVYFDRTEGLVYVADRLVEYRAVRAEVRRLTSEESIVVSDQSDKLFFPDRRVITPGDRPFWTYPEIARALPRLADVVPVYVYAQGAPSPMLEAWLREHNLVYGSPHLLLNGARLYPLIHL